MNLKLLEAVPEAFAFALCLAELQDGIRRQRWSFLRASAREKVRLALSASLGLHFDNYGVKYTNVAPGLRHWVGFSSAKSVWIGFGIMEWKRRCQDTLSRIFPFSPHLLSSSPLLSACCGFAQQCGKWILHSSFFKAPWAQKGAGSKRVAAH